MSTNPNLRAIFPLFLTVFVDSIGMGLIFPLLTPLFFSAQSILTPETTPFAREILFGLTLAVFPLGMFFSTPVLGELSDEIGRKKIILFCLSGVAISYFLSGAAVMISSLTLLIISRVIAGICAGSIATAQAAIIDVCPPEEKTKYLSLLLFPVSLGFVAGPLFGALFANNNWVSWFGLWTPLAFAGIVATLNIILLVVNFKETHVEKGKIHLNLSSAILLFRDAFYSPKIRLLSIVFLLFETAWSLYFQYISVFMFQRFHYDNNSLGLFMAFLATGFAFSFLYLIPKLSRKFSNMFLFRTSLIATAIFTLLSVAVPIASIVWIATFFNSAANAIAYSTSISLFSDTVGPEHQGWIMGVTAAVLSLAFALTAICSSFLGMIDITAPLYAAVIATAIGAYLSYKLK